MTVKSRAGLVTGPGASRGPSMTPTFEFSRVAAYYQEIPSGVAITVELIAVATCLGIAAASHVLGCARWSRPG
ncbi:hypothetical protein IE4803_CH00058 [Rhizobium etli bv. phaseoli str. IE4803]|nr:hypothetical protein IE4803_CH00058 [Rhizobium etli bv. phaseoli str. IE4803]